MIRDEASFRGLRVVITGASSGIGRAAAMAFARKGASVALAARRENLLNEVAEACGRLGGRALVAPTDVTDAAAVQYLADRTQEAFGGIDVWISNAGVGVYGPYVNAGPELHRRVIEVNLVGAMNGVSAVLPLFIEQGHGVLIQNISLGGWAPTPLAAAYTASKFGLRGLTASLRQELVGRRDIHICSVFPAIVDTPGFLHGANVSDHVFDPGPLLYRAEDVADVFVSLARRPRDEVAVGWPSRAGQLGYVVARGPMERVGGLLARKLAARGRPMPRTDGAVLEPLPEGRAPDGGWLARKRLPPARVLTSFAAGGLLLTLAAGLWLRRRRPMLDMF